MKTIKRRRGRDLLARKVGPVMERIPRVLDGYQVYTVDFTGWDEYEPSTGKRLGKSFLVVAVSAEAAIAKAKEVCPGQIDGVRSDWVDRHREVVF